MQVVEIKAPLGAKDGTCVDGVQEPKECAWEDDGACDPVEYPSSCPVGTDLADCAGQEDVEPVEEGCSLTLGSSEEEGIATTTCALTAADADADVPVVGSCAARGETDTGFRGFT